MAENNTDPYGGGYFSGQSSYGVEWTSPEDDKKQPTPEEEEQLRKDAALFRIKQQQGYADASAFADAYRQEGFSETTAIGEMIAAGAHIQSAGLENVTWEMSNGQSLPVAARNNEVMVSFENGGGAYPIRTFVQKYFRQLSPHDTLIVHEGQEALVQINGELLATYGPGRYGFDDIDFYLSNDGSTRSKTTFAEVYFVNTTEQMGILWGTPDRLVFQIPQYNFSLSIGASGDMALVVRESKKLFMKLVGTELLLSQQALLGYFKSILIMHLKAVIAQQIQQNEFTVFEIDAHLPEFAQEVKNRIKPIFAEYGVELTQLTVSSISYPDDDPMYQKYRELHFAEFAAAKEAQRLVIEAKGLAEKRSLEGYTYQQEREYELAELEFEHRLARAEALAEVGQTVVGAMSTGMAAAATFRLGMPVPYGALAGIPVGHPAVTEPGLPESESALPRLDTNHQLSLGVITCPYCAYQYSATEQFCPRCGKGRL